jgi:hypothetical protein
LSEAGQLLSSLSDYYEEILIVWGEGINEYGFSYFLSSFFFLVLNGSLLSDRMKT